MEPLKDNDNELVYVPSDNDINTPKSAYSVPSFEDVMDLMLSTGYSIINKFVSSASGQVILLMAFSHFLGPKWDWYQNSYRLHIVDFTHRTHIKTLVDFISQYGFALLFTLNVVRPAINLTYRIGSYVTRPIRNLSPISLAKETRSLLGYGGFMGTYLVITAFELDFEAPVAAEVLYTLFQESSDLSYLATAINNIKYAMMFYNIGMSPKLRAYIIWFIEFYILKTVTGFETNGGPRTRDGGALFFGERIIGPSAPFKFLGSEILGTVFETIVEVMTEFQKKEYKYDEYVKEYIDWHGDERGEAASKGSFLSRLISAAYTWFYDLKTKLELSLTQMIGENGLIVAKITTFVVCGMLMAWYSRQLYYYYFPPSEDSAKNSNANKIDVIIEDVKDITFQVVDSTEKMFDIISDETSTRWDELRQIVDEVMESIDSTQVSCKKHKSALLNILQDFVQTVNDVTDQVSIVFNFLKLLEDLIESYAVTQEKMIKLSDNDTIKIIEIDKLSLIIETKLSTQITLLVRKIESVKDEEKQSAE